MMWKKYINVTITMPKDEDPITPLQLVAGKPLELAKRAKSKSFEIMIFIIQWADLFDAFVSNLLLETSSETPNHITLLIM